MYWVIVRTTLLLVTYFLKKFYCENSDLRDHVTSRLIWKNDGAGEYYETRKFSFAGIGTGSQIQKS